MNKNKKEFIMSKKRHNAKRIKNKKVRTKRYFLASLSLIFAIIFIVAGSGFVYAGNLLNQYNYIPIGTDIEGNNNADGKSGTMSLQKNYKDPTQIDGLYHDDAVINILIIGTDEFHGGGGRSDSMMLLSIDRRHKKLKLTSFMRDLYLQLTDGWAPNRINAAYTLGGADCLIRTIESNFSVDIDKYVLVDYTDLDSIIDLLGGVEIELSAAEANQINIYSEEYSTYATSGLNNLSGKQARYYMRIRDVAGDDGYGDFSRTSRQRKVFSNLLNKFKSSSFLTITKLASQIVPEVTTNLSQEEITTLISSILTYMNYDFHQSRVPADGMYYDDYVVISGYDSAVLIPDLELNTAYVNNFIYEDSFPELSQTLSNAGF